MLDEKIDKMASLKTNLQYRKYHKTSVKTVFTILWNGQLWEFILQAFSLLKDRWKQQQQQNFISSEVAQEKRLTDCDNSDKQPKFMFPYIFKMAT